jgi:hypothetical protein
MKAPFLTAIVLLCLCPLAFALQDPRDPGIQDSIIVGATYVDSGGTFAFVPIYAVTDDSVAFYNLPIRWIAPQGGVYAAARTQYFFPLTSWDSVFDSVVISQDFIRQVGWADIYPDSTCNPLLNTRGLRVNFMTMRFIIDPNSPPQLICLDTCYDERNLSMEFGLIDGIAEFPPAFVNGWIGVFTGVDEPIVPASFYLSQNYPNPFNPTTKIDFNVPVSGSVSLIVYDLLGREVRELLQETLLPGNHSIIWDGTNNDGANVPSGVYFYRLTSSNYTSTKRMTLLR